MRGLPECGTLPINGFCGGLSMNKLYHVAKADTWTFKYYIVHGLFFLLYGFVKYLPFPFMNQVRFLVIRLFAPNIHASHIWDGVFIWFPWRVRMGRNSTLRQGVIVDGFGGVDIGDNVRIASYVSINTSDHDYAKAHVPIAEQGYICGKVVIEDDVWIGVGANIQKGVTIGKGAVVGAHSVVMNDVPPYTVVAGNPAQIIRKRQ